MSKICLLSGGSGTLVSYRMLIVEPHRSALFSKLCLLLVPKNKDFFSLCQLCKRLFPSCLEKKQNTKSILGEAREEPQLPSWKCPSLLSPKNLPFGIAAPLPAPQQQPHHNPSTSRGCSLPAPALPRGQPSPPAAKQPGTGGAGPTGSHRVGAQRRLCRELEGGWLGDWPPPRHRLLWGRSLSCAQLWERSVGVPLQRTDTSYLLIFSCFGKKT